MKRVKPDLSIIIVNYNVKEFLANCIDSIWRAAGTLDVEIIIVDNASTDGSRPFLEKHFSQLTYIWNEQNVGFGAANNQAISIAQGEHILLLNPDTILQENTLEVMHSFMNEHPDTGLAGCKILNPDGTFAPESRRSVPTISNSFYKTLGLAALFPKSRAFSDYYLGWMDPGEQSEVPVLSGSFMYFRGSVLKQLGGFDERFFMYGEDIDLCVRIAQKGYNIVYLPSTSIIHYKGESSKKDDIRYIRHFNEAMILFFKKYHSGTSSFLFQFLIQLAIVIRAIASFVVAKTVSWRSILIDILLINLSLQAALFIYEWIPIDRRYDIDPDQILIWNIILSCLYLLFGKYELQHKRYLYITNLAKSISIAYLGLVVITFFFKHIAFSRLIILIGYLLSLGTVTMSNILLSNRSKLKGSIGKKWFSRRVLLIGSNSKTDDLVQKLHTYSEVPIDIMGVIRQEQWEPLSHKHGQEIVPVIGSLDQTKNLVKELKISHVVVNMEAIRNYELLDLISQLKKMKVKIAVVPKDLDVLLGKDFLEGLQELNSL